MPEQRPMSASAALLMEVLAVKVIAAVLIDGILDEAGNGRQEKLKELVAAAEAKLRVVAVPKEMAAAAPQIAKIVQANVRTFFTQFAVGERN